MNEKNKVKKVLVVHPFLNILGGAEFVALQIIAIILKNYRYEVTILTYNELSVARIYEYFDISKYLNLVKFIKIKLPFLLRFSKGRFHTLKIAYIHRLAKRIACNYDICISTYNEIDFGKIGIQYIHHPNYADYTYLSHVKIANLDSLRNKVPCFDRVYKILLKLIAKYNIDGFKRNITLVNSHFMGEIIRNLYDIKAIVLYPSIISMHNIKSQNWEERLFQFISIGRISPEKNFLELINVFLAIAKKYPLARFIIAWRVGDQKYYKRLCHVINDLKINIKILTDIGEEDRNNLYRTSKFYIHAKTYEHFGISILEAANAGCLTFVHNSGGMREIVNPDILRFNNMYDLLMKISKLIDDNNLRVETLNSLRESVKNYSIDNFNNIVCSVLNDFQREYNI